MLQLWRISSDNADLATDFRPKGRSTLRDFWLLKVVPIRVRGAFKSPGTQRTLTPAKGNVNGVNRGSMVVSTGFAISPHVRQISPRTPAPPQYFESCS
jgi:hypothetical protein